MLSLSPIVYVIYAGFYTHFTHVLQITLAAGACDLDGSIASVTFQKGSVVLAKDTSAPYTGSIKSPIDASSQHFVLALA